MICERLRMPFDLHFTMPPKNWWVKVFAISALLFLAGWLFSFRFSIGINSQVMGCIRGTVFIVDHQDKTPVVGLCVPCDAGRARVRERDADGEVSGGWAGRHG